MSRYCSVTVYKTTDSPRFAKYPKIKRLGIDHGVGATVVFESFRGDEYQDQIYRIDESKVDFTVTSPTHQFWEAKDPAGKTHIGIDHLFHWQSGSLFVFTENQLFVFTFPRDN
jgi:hypothetical protein